MSSPSSTPPPQSSRLPNYPNSAPVTFPERSTTSNNSSYIDAAGEELVGETDRLLPAATDPAPPVARDAAGLQVTSHEEKGILSRFFGHLSTMHFTVPTIHLPSLPQYVTFDYPSLRGLGRVRLPEDEEATRDNEPNAPSRFTNYWTSIKKKQFRLRWYHYVLLVLVILAATVPPIVVAIVRHARRHSYRYLPVIQRCPNAEELSLRLDQSYYRQGRQEYRHAASTSFSVPGDVANLQLYAFVSHGSVRFVLDNNTEYADQTRRNITIDVTAFMDDWNAFQRDIEVCRSGPWGWDRSTGLRIGSMPVPGRSVPPSSKTAFEVTVRLPAGSATSPMQLRGVSGILRNFEVSIDDLQDRVIFEEFSLSTGNMPIHAESLIATAALTLRTTNAPISGTFRAPHIDINTDNGEIRANASVTTQAGGPLGANGKFYTAPYLRMTSVHRAIIANIDLVKPHTWGRHEPVFPIEVRTSDAPINLTIAAAEKTQLTMSTQNTFGPTTVTLPDTYIGAFSMNTWSGWNQPLAHFDQEHDRLGRAMRVTTLFDRGISGNIHLPDSPRNTFQLPGSRVAMSSQLGELDLYI